MIILYSEARAGTSDRVGDHSPLFLFCRRAIASKPFFFDAIGAWRSVIAVADDVAMNVPHESGTGRARELWPIRVI